METIIAVFKAIFSYFQTSKTRRRAKLEELVGVEFNAMKKTHDDFLQAIRRIDLTLNEIQTRLKSNSALGDDFVRELRRLYDFLVEHRYDNIAERRRSYELAGAIIDSHWPDHKSILVEFSKEEIERVRNLMDSLRSYFETNGRYGHDLMHLTNTVASILAREEPSRAVDNVNLIIERKAAAEKELTEKWAKFVRQYAEVQLMLQ